jgi:hypothetical protein
VLGPVFPSQDLKRQANAEVDVKKDCSHTSRLWIGHPEGSYKVELLIPSKPRYVGDGIEVLGWSRKSNLLLVSIAQWSYEGEGGYLHGVLSIDPETGTVNEVDLKAIGKGHKDKRCDLRVSGAGFDADPNIILVRAQLFTELDPGDDEEDIPVAERCGKSEETWSFNTGNGEIKQVDNNVLFLMSRGSLPPVGAKP